MNNLKGKKKPKNRDFIEIFGIHSVKAAIKNNKRNHEELVISYNSEKIISQKMRDSVKKIVKLPKNEFNKIYGNEKNHQGIILKTSNLIQPSLDEILNSSQKNKPEIIIMLDQVTDPQNIGSILRSCALFNCKSIIISKDNAPEINSTITKIASGAIEKVSYVKVTNFLRTINKFKKNNFWVYGLDNNIKNNNIDKFAFPEKCLFILGAEGKGLRQLTKKECDDIISIPTNLSYEVDSLNVSNACSIILYEHFKKFEK